MLMFEFSRTTLIIHFEPKIKDNFNFYYQPFEFLMVILLHMTLLHLIIFKIYNFKGYNVDPCDVLDCCHDSTMFLKLKIQLAESKILFLLEFNRFETLGVNNTLDYYYILTRMEYFQSQLVYFPNLDIFKLFLNMMELIQIEICFNFQRCCGKDLFENVILFPNITYM